MCYKTAGTIAIALISALSLGACSNSAEDSQGSGSSSATSGFKVPTGDDLKSVASSLEQSARELVQKLQNEFTQQLEQHQPQIEQLKSSAKQFSDEQLDALIAKIDAQLAIARNKLNEIKNAEGGTVQAMRSEFDAAMAEVKKLYQQAMSRLTELQNSKGQ